MNNNRFLRIKPFHGTLHYGVMLAMFRSTVSNVLKYETTVSYLDAKSGYHIYEVNRLANIFVNEEEISLVADKLASDVASVLYPLQLRVSEGRGIVGIHNFKEIQSRWIDVKQKILKFNEGETVEKYLSLNESTLKTERTLLYSLRSDWFLYGYFNPVCIPYNGDSDNRSSVYPPFIFGSKGVEYTVFQNSKLEVDNRGYIIRSFEGYCDDKRCVEDLESSFSHLYYSSENKVTGSYNAYYMLNGKDHSIDSFRIDTSLDLNEKRIISMVVYQLEK